MSFRIEQKIGNNIYFYEVTSVWNSEKKQPRQKRKYLGRKDPDTGCLIPANKSARSKCCLDFGASYLLNYLARDIGLVEVMDHVFGDESKDLLNLAMFQICEKSPLYLFKEWAQSAFLHPGSVLSSQDISRWLQDLGERDLDRAKFVDLWIHTRAPKDSVVFDITSLSSYGRLIEILEWGYNRDKERLPQINVGLVMSEPQGIPLTYQIYPGSIHDVSALSRIIADMKSRSVGVNRFILDRGFYSRNNIRKMSESGMSFIMPMPYTTKLASQVLKDSSRIASAMAGFVFENKPYCYDLQEICVEGVACKAHTYMDHQKRADEIEQFIRSLSAIEASFLEGGYPAKQSLLDAMKERTPGMNKYYEIENEGGIFKLIRNEKAIIEALDKMGKIILITTDKNLNRDDVLMNYKRRDKVEKLFDLVKNELDSNRIRVHSKEALYGRLFLIFVALILQSEVARRAKESKLIKEYSISEMMLMLKNIRSVEMINGRKYLTEISKRQKEIFQALQIPIPTEPSY
jgi:transposase